MNIQHKKIGLPRLLIVGCGDIGLRLLPWVRHQFRVYAVTTQSARCGELRKAGAIPIVADLDCISSQLIRLSQLADVIIHLAPPNASKNVDFRTRHLISLLPSRAKVIYISTTGVYGAQMTDHIHEHCPARPDQLRGIRRLDAEQALRHWAIRQHGHLVILRVAGIYAESRLPLARIKALAPVLLPEEDGLINLIHADDLAHIIYTAITRGLPQRTYNVCSDIPESMGSYMTKIAQHYDLPAPPQLPLAQVKQQVSEEMLSYMTSRRRIDNSRLKQELGVCLRYPDLDHFLRK